MSVRSRWKPLTVAFVLALFPVACDEVSITDGETGSGNLVTEAREVDSFDGIIVSSAINLQVSVDSEASRAVTVTYDDNILDNLVTRVDGDTLIIELEGSLNLTGDVARMVEVVTPTLVELDASGAASVDVTGSTPGLALTVSGASSVDLNDFEVGDVDVDASGASSVLINATGDVTGSASGASSVTVRGNPTNVSIDTSGASSVDVP